MAKPDLGHRSAPTLRAALLADPIQEDRHQHDREPGLEALGDVDGVQRAHDPDLDEFVACFNPANRQERVATWEEEQGDGRFRAYTYDEIMARDKVNLDIFWLRDESLEDTENLPDPDVIAEEIVEELEAALEQFRLIVEDLG
jgi:hypothetical protein